MTFETSTKLLVLALTLVINADRMRGNADAWRMVIKVANEAIDGDTRRLDEVDRFINKACREARRRRYQEQGR